MKDNIKIVDEYITQSKKKKNRKKNRKGRKFGNKHFKNPEILLKSKTLKKNDKEEFRDLLFDGFPALADQLRKLYNGKNVKFDTEDVVDAFSNKKFLKAFLSVCEEYLDEGVEVPDVYGYMISEFYLSDCEIKEDGKSFKKLLKIFETMNEKKIEKLRKEIKKAGVDKKEAKLAALKFALYSADYRGFKKLKGRMHKFFRELYRSFNNGEKVRYKTIHAIIHTCYGKKMPIVVSMLLADKANVANGLKTSEEKEVYSIVTNIALNFIKKMDKDDRKVLLKKYARMREGNANVKRRVNLYSGLADDYKAITKTIDRLINNGFRRELFE